MKISIIIPTINEKKNIETLVPEIFRVLNGEDLEIIIVDDGSEDGTRDTAKNLGKNYNLRLIEREKKMGIGSAYRDGFKAARGELLFEMDADWSHDPRFLPDFLKKIESGFDVVLGSRYLPGGKRKDPIHRRIFPILGNILYKKLLKFPTTDTTAGYRVYRREVLDRIELNDLPNDFSFQSAIIFRLMKSGVKIGEVPIEFENRKFGEPKYSAVDLFGNMKLLLKLFIFKKI